MQNYTNDMVKKIDSYLHPTPKPPVKPIDPPPVTHVNQVYRNMEFPAQRLQSETEIDAYVEMIRTKLRNALNGADAVDVK